MTSSPSSHDQQIRRLLEGINEAWTAGRLEDLVPFFHRDMVIAGPGGERLGVGREACIASYRDFVSSAVLKEFIAAEPSVDVIDQVAVATYTFDITYEMAGESFQESGRDLFVFARENEGWQAVWRTLLPLT